jgi:sulfite reductase (NADPH) hemoprotein beta-component
VAATYHYNAADRTLVRERVAQFRDQVDRRLAGALSEEAFRPLRLMNGLYLQLHAYMLRVAIPYGTLSPDQMHKLADIARRYDRGFGHFTTRQNIQFNWIKLEETPDLLADLADVDMHAIQTSGNVIRNVTADHYAGAAADEIDDSRAYAEIIRQWSTLHPEFSFLPRKFKIAVTASATDRAALKVHDIGVRLHLKGEERGFEVMVGGGQGRTPMIAKTIRDFLSEPDMLSYLEAILRVYNRLGRRDNKYKARIKILVHELGAEAFTAAVEQEWQAIKDGPLALPASEIARIRQHFHPPPFLDLDSPNTLRIAKAQHDPEFDRWLRVNTKPHKHPGYAIVDISLKPTGGIPGDATADQMDAVADLATRYSFDEIRVTHTQNLVLPHVEESALHDLWQALNELGLATPKIGLAGDIISCPGMDYCSLATARSIPISQKISERLADSETQEDLGTLGIKISGCINACGHHHIGNIGILGLEKKGQEYYQLTLGGDAGADASLGDVVGKSFSADGIVDAVEKVTHAYLGLRTPGEKFINTYRRVGPTPFKEILYAAA